MMSLMSRMCYVHQNFLLWQWFWWQNNDDRDDDDNKIGDDGDQQWLMTVIMTMTAMTHYDIDIKR
jgi:hypothetical protein